MKYIGMAAAFCAVALTCFALVANAVESSPAANEVAATKRAGGTSLEALAARLKELRTVPRSQRARLLAQFDAAVKLVQGQRDIELQKQVSDAVVCASFLAEQDLGDRPAQAVLRRQLILPYLPLAANLPVETEDKLIGSLGPGTAGPRAAENIDANGKAATGRQWQLLRNELLERRLHLWRRIIDAMDSQASAGKDADHLGLSPDGEVLKLTPEALADPVARAQHEAAIEAQRNGVARHTPLSAYRKLRETNLARLKESIALAYKMPPVTPEDLDVLKAYLHVYVSDETLRTELFEIAQTSAKGSAGH